VKFHDPYTSFRQYKEGGLSGIPRGLQPLPFYKEMLRRIHLREQKEGLTAQSWGHAFRAAGETLWYQSGQLYYKVYPSITECLTRVRIDVKLEQLNLSDTILMLRFAEGHEPAVGTLRPRTMLVRGGSDTEKPSGLAFSYLMAVAYSGEAAEIAKVDSRNGETMEDQLKSKDSGREGLIMCPLAAIRIALSVVLMKSDPDFVTRDVLNADRERFEKTGDPKYIERAKRRGVNGFSIGREFETIPHIRRPHLGLRWTGEGRKVAKIVPIKAAIVHRQKVTTVPTGAYTPEGKEKDR
jgi:hypothetical protein